jgi:hypothetical protein
VNENLGWILSNVITTYVLFGSLSLITIYATVYKLRSKSQVNVTLYLLLGLLIGEATYIAQMALYNVNVNLILRTDVLT